MSALVVVALVLTAASCGYVGLILGATLERARVRAGILALSGNPQHIPKTLWRDQVLAVIDE